MLQQQYGCTSDDGDDEDQHKEAEGRDVGSVSGNGVILV